MVLKRIKARYTNGVLEPSEPLGLEEGAVVEVALNVREHVHASDEMEDADLAPVTGEDLTVEGRSDEEAAAPLTPEEARARFLASAGGWKGHHDDPDELIRMLYEARITGSREPPNL